MKVKRVPKIFISYRRDDTSGHVNHLHEILTRHFGADHIFRDIRDIGPGEAFAETIKAEINSSDILLAVIGKDWLTITEGKRSANEDDYVRLEIVTALDRGRDIVVVPVLVEDAKLPRTQDLPDDLKGLVGLQAVELSDRWWPRDVNQLIEDLEKAFGESGKGETGIPPPTAKSSVPNSLYSLFGGAMAGLVTGTIVGVIYSFQQNIPYWGLRIILVGLYGLFAGAMLSFFINSGIAKSSKLLNNSPYSKIIGGTFGGALGGILAAIAGGFGFGLLGGGQIDPLYVMVAVGLSTIFIILGILLPDLHDEWYKRILVIIILVCVTLVSLFITAWLIEKPLAPYLGNISDPFSPGVLILGLISGVMSGVQAGSALFVYYRFNEKSESTKP